MSILWLVAVAYWWVLLLFCLLVVQFLRHVCALGECVSFELNWSLSWLKLNLFRSNCISFFQAIYTCWGLAAEEQSGGFVNFICLTFILKYIVKLQPSWIETDIVVKFDLFVRVTFIGFLKYVLREALKFCIEQHSFFKS